MITGNGHAFCHSNYLKQILGNSKPAPTEFLGRAKKTGGLAPLADVLLHIDIPDLAAVNGLALGWALKLALMAVVRVESERAKSGGLYVVRRSCCNAPSLGRLAQLVGRENTAKLLFTGDVIDSNLAKTLGLVGRVVSHEDLQSNAMEIGLKSRRSPLTVQTLKFGPRRTRELD